MWQSYFVVYILITVELWAQWGLRHSWILSPLRRGRARSCSVVNWTEAKGRGSSQARERNFYHCNETWAGKATRCYVGAEESNPVKGCNFSVRILSLPFFWAIYHTKHKPGVCEHEVNLTSNLVFLADSQAIFILQKNHCLFQPGWRPLTLFQTTDMNQKIKVISSLHMPWNFLPIHVLQLLVIIKTLATNLLNLFWSFFSLLQLWATDRDMKVCIT